MKASKIRQRYQVRGYPLQAERRVELAAVLSMLLVIVCLSYNGVRLLTVTPPAPVIPNADSLVVAGVSDPSIVAANDRKQIGDRPLFWRSRTPLVPPPDEDSSEDAATEGVVSLENVKLLGVFGSANSVGIIALVEGEKQRILAGDKILGWELKSVEGSRAQFTEGLRSAELELKLANVTPIEEQSSETNQQLIEEGDPINPLEPLEPQEPLQPIEKAISVEQHTTTTPAPVSSGAGELTVGGAPAGAQPSDLQRAVNSLNEASNSRYTRQSSD